MTDGNITKDIMYDAVAPDDFESMIELDRYEKRSTAFDKIISATHDHFWDPLDKAYIDFDVPFDMENTPLVPEDMVVSLSTNYVSDALQDPKARTRFMHCLPAMHNLDTELGRVADIGYGPRRADQGLGRHATVVQTIAPHQVLLDQL